MYVSLQLHLLRLIGIPNISRDVVTAFARPSRKEVGWITLVIVTQDKCIFQSSAESENQTPHFPSITTPFSSIPFRIADGSPSNY